LQAINISSFKSAIHLPDDFALQVPSIDTSIACITSSCNDIKVLGLLKTISNNKKMKDESVR